MIIIFFFFFLYVLVGQFKQANKLGGYVFYVLLLSLLLRLLILFLYENGLMGLVDAGSDTESFKRQALYLFNHVNTENLIRFWEIQGREGTFPILMALLYKFFSPEYLTVSFLNVLLHNAVILNQAKAQDYLMLQRKQKLIFLMIIAFFPMLLSYSVILLREMFFVFYVSLVLLNILSFHKKGRLKTHFVFLIIYSAITIILHPGMLLFVVFSFLIMFYKKTFKWQNIIIGVLLYFAITTAITAGYGGGYFDFLLRDPSADAVFDRMSGSREGSIFRYEKLYQQNLVYNIFVALPVDYFNFLFSPLPIPIGNLLYYGLWRYPVGLLWSFTMIVFVFRIKKVSFLTGQLIFLLLIGALPFVLGSGDVLQAVRHKMKFFPVLIFLLALLYEKSPNLAKSKDFTGN